MTGQAAVSSIPAKPKRSWSHRLRALFAGLIGLALLIGIPYCLVQFVGNPIQSFPGSFSEVSDYIARRFIPSEVIIGLLAIVMWLLWLQYVWALVWELAVVGPAAAKGQLARSAPFAPRAVRSVASAVVSGLLTASVVVSSSSLASLGAHAISSPAALATESQPSMNEPAQAAAESAALDGQRVYVVGQRESLWSIAGQDEVVLKRLLEINEDQIRSPIDVRPGMELIVPAGLISERSGDADARTGEPEQSGGRGTFDGDRDDEPADSHTVVKGDNLWKLSEARLRAETGTEPTDRQIAERVAEVVAQNQGVIEDPDLIYPGEVLTITGGPAGPMSIPVPASTSSPEAADDESQGPVPAAPYQPVADETRPLQAVSNDEEAEAADDNSQSGTAGPGDAGDADDDEAAASAEDRDEQQDADESSEVGVVSQVALAAIAGGLTAAGALLAVLVGLKRRRAATLGFTSARRSMAGPDGDRLIRDLAGGADHEFTLWVAEQLHGLMAGLSPTGGVAPSAVRLELNSWLSAESGVAVMWDAPMPTPLGDWRVRDEREWFLAYDDTTATVLPESKPAALPGLVTLGQLTGERQTGQEFLIDLEAHASLALSGSADQINAVARAIAYEAAAGELLSNFRVTTVDFTLDGLDTLERLSPRSEEVALTHAETIVEQYRNRPDDEPDQPGGPMGRDVELFILNTVQANTDRWLEIATPRSGIALLLIGDMRSSRLGARLAIGDDGVGTLSPFAVELNVGGILPETAVRLGALFDQLLDDPDESGAAPEMAAIVSPAEVVADWAQSAVERAVELEGAAELAEPIEVAGADWAVGDDVGADPADRGASAAQLAAEAADHASLSRAVTAPVPGRGLVINVMGQCRCDELPGLVSRALSLVAFLAVQPERAATREVIADAVWGGRRVSDGQFSKVVAAARAELGPTRLPKQLSADGLYRLEQVETDFHQFQRLALRAEQLEGAEAAPLLKAALEMVTGPPFGGVAIDWAAGRRFDEYCSELIEATVVRAIEVLAQLDDHAGVHEAAKTGLRALPANEPIYRAYMTVAAARGQLPFARSMYDHLCEKLSLLYPTENAVPSRQTRELLAQLSERVSVESG